MCCYLLHQNNTPFLELVRMIKCRVSMGTWKLSLIVKLIAIIIEWSSTNSHCLGRFIPVMVASHLIFSTTFCWAAGHVTVPAYENIATSATAVHSCGGFTLGYILIKFSSLSFLPGTVLYLARLFSVSVYISQYIHSGSRGSYEDVDYTKFDDG